MIKQSGLEDSDKSDPVHGKGIRISTTVRIAYRKVFHDPDFRDFTHTRNSVLNDIIAQDFINSSSKIVHYFPLSLNAGGSKDVNGQKAIGEIRNLTIGGGGVTHFFVSIIREGYIDILTLQGKYMKTKTKTKQNIESQIDFMNKARI